MSAPKYIRTAGSVVSLKLGRMLQQGKDGRFEWDELPPLHRVVGIVQLTPNQSHTIIDVMLLDPWNTAIIRYCEISNDSEFSSSSTIHYPADDGSWWAAIYHNDELAMEYCLQPPALDCLLIDSQIEFAGLYFPTPEHDAHL